MHAAKPIPLSQSFIDDPVWFRGNFWACPFFLLGVSSGGSVSPLSFWERDLHTKVSLWLLLSLSGLLLFEWLTLVPLKSMATLSHWPRVLVSIGCATKHTWLSECSSSLALVFYWEDCRLYPCFAKEKMGMEGLRVSPKASELREAKAGGWEMRYGWKAAHAASVCCAQVSFLQPGFPGQQTICRLASLKILEFEVSDRIRWLPDKPPL